jgi:hypothetical protein
MNEDDCAHEEDIILQQEQETPLYDEVILDC